MTLSRVKGLMLALAAIILSAGMFSAESAQADGRFCNKTSRAMLVAAKFPVGSMNALTWLTTGWYGLEPGQCTVSFVEGNMTNVNVHFTAITRNNYGNLEFINLGPSRPMHYSCVTVNDAMYFKIYGEYSTCPSGYYMAPFHKFTGYSYNMEFSISD